MALPNVSLAVTGACLAGTALLAYAVCTAVYNLWFHPLANYPGPLLARASLVRRIPCTLLLCFRLV